MMRTRGEKPTAVASTPSVDVLAMAAAALREDTPRADRLREILAAMAIAEAEANAAADAAESFETANILDASQETYDEVLDETARSIVVHRRRAKRLSKVAALVRDKIVDTDAADLEAVRLDRYRAAERVRAEAETWVRTVYAEHASAIAAGLVRLEEIAGIVEAANDDRPAGVPVLDLEDFRALAPKRGERSVRQETYYVNSLGEEMTPDSQRPLGQGASGAFFIPDGEGRLVPVYVRTREVVVISDASPGARPRALAGAVFLPRVHYTDLDFWPRRSVAWLP